MSKEFENTVNNKLGNDLLRKTIVQSRWKWLHFGRDEKGCLLSTKKNAAVDVNCQRQPVETVCLHLFYWSCQPYCSFLLVGVNWEKCSCRQRWHFSWLIVFFTCCPKWTQACSHIIGYIPGPIGSLFAVAPTHILEWQFCYPFMHLGITDVF